MSLVHLLYRRKAVTRSGKRANKAVVPPSSQKSCLRYIRTRNRSMTTAPNGRKTLYIVLVSEHDWSKGRDER